LDERNPESDNEEINPVFYLLILKLWISLITCVFQDYEIIPISEFGTAFLRGCGWKEDTGIGKTNQRAIPLKIFEPRPKGLGLGASIPTQNTGTKSNGTINANRDDNIRRKNDEADDEELKPLGRNSYVLLLGTKCFNLILIIDSTVWTPTSPTI
jgi:hypothetical protein